MNWDEKNAAAEAAVKEHTAEAARTFAAKAL